MGGPGAVSQNNGYCAESPSRNGGGWPKRLAKCASWYFRAGRGGGVGGGGGGGGKTIGQFAGLETCAEVPGAPGATPITVGPPDSHNGRQEATCAPPPPRRRTLAAVSAPAEETRAPNWKVHTRRSNWSQGRPTHGSETSPNRTHSNAQADHEVRAQQQPPNAAHAERAISKQAPPPPSLHEVPTNSGNCTPRAGRYPLRGWQQGRDQLTAHGTVSVIRRREIRVRGGAGGWDRSGCAKGAPWSANRQGEEQHRHTGRGSHTRRDECKHSRQGGVAQQGRRGTQDREPEWRGGESVRIGGSDNKGNGPASQPVATGCQGNPCSTGIRWGVSPAAQMGCLRNRSGSPSGADQP